MSTQEPSYVALANLLADEVLASFHGSHGKIVVGDAQGDGVLFFLRDGALLVSDNVSERKKMD